MALAHSIAQFRNSPTSRAARDALFDDIFSIVHGQRRNSLGDSIRKSACKCLGFNGIALTPNQKKDFQDSYPKSAAGDAALFMFITTVILKKKKNGRFSLTYSSDNEFVGYVARAVVNEVQNDFPDELYPSFEIEPPCSRGSGVTDEDVQAYRSEFEARLMHELNAMNNKVSPMYRLAIYCDYANKCWRQSRNISADVSNSIWSAMAIAANLPQAEGPNIGQLAKAQHGAAVWNQLARLAGRTPDHFRREAKKMARRRVNQWNETFAEVVERCNEEAIGSLSRLNM